VAAKLSQILADIAQIDKSINRAQQMILRDVIFQRELIKQRRLCLLLWSHHRQIPRFYRGIESAKGLQINKSFSTEFALRVERRFRP